MDGMVEEVSKVHMDGWFNDGWFEWILDLDILSTWTEGIWRRR